MFNLKFSTAIRTESSLTQTAFRAHFFYCQNIPDELVIKSNIIYWSQNFGINLNISLKFPTNSNSFSMLFFFFDKLQFLFNQREQRDNLPNRQSGQL